jgi:hypothetical protein
MIRDMALSLIVYASQGFIPPPFGPPFTTYVQKQVQSADADDMAIKVQQALDEIEQLNADIAVAYAALTPTPSQPLNDFLMSYADANLAGGGDGHTFVFTLTFTASLLNILAALLGSPALPELFEFQFCLASEEDALATTFHDMTERFALKSGPGTPIAIAIWQQVAGAAKGTRFMGGVGGVFVPPDQLLRRGVAPTARGTSGKRSLADLVAAADALTGGLLSKRKNPE